MKNIIIIGSAYPYRAGGIRTFNERLATACQDQNIPTTIYTFTFQYPHFLFPGSNQYASDKSNTSHSIPIVRAIHSLSPPNWLRVGRRLYKLKPDAILVRYWTPFMAPCFGTILRLVKRNKHTKIIALTDNIIPHERHFGDTLLTRYFLGPADSVITLSEKVKNELESIPNKIKIIRRLFHPLYDNLGSSTDPVYAREQLGLPAHNPIFLFFGFIRKYKGLHLLLEAMAQVIRKYPEARLVIAGEFYDNPRPYYDLIRKLNLKNYLFMHTHFIPNKHIATYFSAADIVVQPYISASQSGISALGMHFEKPVIATNVGGIPEMIIPEKTGFICEPTAESIAARLIHFLSLPLRDFSTAIIQEKQKYTWSHFVKEIENIYETLCTSKN